MILTNEDIKKLFPHGASLVDKEDEDAVPIRGRLEPHPDDETFMDLWVADGANSVLPREVEPENDYYVLQHWGRPHVLVALRKDREVIL